MIGNEKDRLLNRIFRILAVLGAFAYVPSAYAAAMGGFFVLAALDTAVYAAVVAFSLFPRIPYRVRLVTLVALSSAVAAVVLFYTGPLGAGYIWFMASVLIAALFGGKGTVYAAVGSTAAAFVVYALALSRGLEGFGLPPLTVTIIGSNLLVICISLAAIIRLLLGRLSDALEGHRRLAARLSHELSESEGMREKLAAALEDKDFLLQEVQHRVNNNMQTILSLMDLEDAQNDADRRTRRRIRALSSVNELMYVRSDSVGANVTDILRATAALLEEDAGGPDGGSSRALLFQDHAAALFLKPQAAIMTAICFGDALAAVLSWGRTAHIDLEAHGSSGTVSIRAAPEADTRRAEETFRELTLDHLARAASEHVEFSFLPPGPDRGPGIALELR